MRVAQGRYIRKLMVLHCNMVNPMYTSRGWHAEEELSMRNYRTKFEPPEIDEALIAAEGLSSDPEEQVEIAAVLMGIEAETVRQHRGSQKPQRNRSRFTLTTTRNGGLRKTPEVVVIKRRPRAAGPTPFRSTGPIDTARVQHL